MSKTPTRRSGVSYWPEFAYLEWPSKLELPTQEQVLAHAYVLLGCDRDSEADRQKVRLSKKIYKPILVMTAMPVLIQVCGLSAKHASRLLGTGRYLMEVRDSVDGYLRCPAAKSLSLMLLCSLVDEQTYKQRRGGRS